MRGVARVPATSGGLLLPAWPRSKRTNSGRAQNMVRKVLSPAPRRRVILDFGTTPALPMATRGSSLGAQPSSSGEPAERFD
jgi:hypothetical protein